MRDARLPSQSLAAGRHAASRRVELALNGLARFQGPAADRPNSAACPSDAKRRGRVEGFSFATAWPCRAARGVRQGVKHAVDRLDIVGDDGHALAAFGVLALKG